MKKIALSILLAVSTLIPAMAYAEGSLKIDSIQFLNAQNGPIYKITDQNVSYKASVTNATAASQSGVLIAAVYEEDDMSLVSVKTQPISDLQTGKSANITDSLSLPATNGYLVNLYLWDSEDSGVSLSQTYGIYDRLIVPSVPENVSVTSSGLNEISLSWLVPDHNLPIDEYEIYCNGTFAGSSKTESFKIPSLQYGTTYDIEVAAKDVAGSVSEKTDVLKAKTTPVAYMILGQTNQYELFNRDIPFSQAFDGGFFSEAVTVGPADDLRECRKIQFIKPYNGNANGAANYLMFDINENYIKNTDWEITIKLTCLDEGTDTIAVEYNSPTNAYTKKSVTKTGTGKWKTFVFKITDAALDNKQIGNTYDFRISTGESNTTEYIQKVEVFKGLVD